MKYELGIMEKEFKKSKTTFRQRFNLGLLLAVSVFVLVVVSGLAITQTANAAWPPDPYAGCVGKVLDASCDGATYGFCKSSNWYGCKAVPSACKVGWDYGLPGGLACIAGLVCSDKDNDSVPECAKASITGAAPAGATGGAYSADSYNYDCDDNDPWSHVRTPDKISSVKVEYSPEYIKATQTEKMFTPKPPFSPLWGSLKITLSLKPPKCKFGNSEGVLGFDVSLVTTDTSGKEVVVPMGQRFFSKTGSSYVATVNIDGNYNIEPFIASVAAKRAVKLRFELKHVGAEYIPATPPAPYDYTFPQTQMTNCAQVYGGDKHKVVYMRGKSATLSVVNISTLANKSVESFLTIPPFKQSSTAFAHYLDLEIYNDNQFSTFTLGGNTFINGYLPQDAGSCGRDKIVRLGYHVLATSRIDIGLAPPGLRTIFLGEAVRAKAGANPGNLILHEFAHSFARLSDEYIYLNKQIPVIYTLFGLAKRNCTTDPDSDYSYGGKLYGSKDYIGCSFILNPSGKALYRPSLNSIMDDGISFNIPSCGWIKKAINGGLAKSYFPECAAMPGIIPVGQ